MELDKKKVVPLLNKILEAELAGVVRYTHIGEGAYRDTEDVIRKLLAEP